MYVILMYDIAVDEQGAKTWKKVFGISKRYLNHIQKSVFEGELSEAQFKKMEIEIKKHLRNELDCVIIFKSRTQKWLDKEIWGIQDDVTSPFL